MAVYSTLLFLGEMLTAGGPTLLIPDPTPNTIVVRDIEGISTGGAPDQAQLGVGTTIDPLSGFMVVSLVQEDFNNVRWRGRLVVPPGNTLYGFPLAYTWNLAVSGYTLTP